MKRPAPLRVRHRFRCLGHRSPGCQPPAPLDCRAGSVPSLRPTCRNRSRLLTLIGHVSSGQVGFQLGACNHRASRRHARPRARRWRTPAASAQPPHPAASQRRRRIGSQVPPSRWRRSTSRSRASTIASQTRRRSGRSQAGHRGGTRRRRLGRAHRLHRHHLDELLMRGALPDLGADQCSPTTARRRVRMSPSTISRYGRFDQPTGFG